MHIPSCVSCYPEYVLRWCWCYTNEALLSSPSVILTSHCFRINNHTIEWIANKQETVICASVSVRHFQGWGASQQIFKKYSQNSCNLYTALSGESEKALQHDKYSGWGQIIYTRASCFTNLTRSAEECWNVSSQIHFKFINLYLARFSLIIIVSRSPRAVFYFFCYAITDSVAQTEWLSRKRLWRSVCVCVCTCACVSALQKGKKICQVWNNGLACVKMNTVIGINDLMGA